MSAQAGIWNFGGKPVDKSLLRKLGDAIAQYAPDGETTYTDGIVTMLYRPFHTTLESRLEHQPHASPQGLVITWDGRLDNRDELISQVADALRGDQTDVAIVAAAYEKWGSHSFEKLIGDWALTIWDPHDQILLMARDYVGTRQLYYYSKYDSLCWSTTLESLVIFSGATFTLNEEYVAGYLAFWPKAELTPYREIHAVPPAHFIRAHDGEVSLHRYCNYDPGKPIRYKTDAEYQEHFREVFRLAVRRRLRSDSPILAELSGGLDSSAIVCMADDILANEGAPTPRLDTLSLYTLDDPGSDDFSYFTKVEEKRGKKGFHVDLKEFGIPVSLQHHRFVALPGGLGTGQELEAQRATIRQQGGYRVVLSGIGGDEFLGGVPNPVPQLVELILQLRLRELAKELRAWGLAKKRPLLHLLAQALVPLLPRTLRCLHTQSTRVDSWIDPKFVRRQRSAIWSAFEESSSWRLSMRGHAQTLTTMARQLAQIRPVTQEKTYPYLDQTLIGFLCSIPPNQLLRPDERRYLMRRALIHLLPPEVLSRRTKATGDRLCIATVQKHWVQIDRILDSLCSSQLGFVIALKFQQALRETKHGKVSPRLVQLMKGLSLELWLRDVTARGIMDVPFLEAQALSGDWAESRA